MSTPAPANGFPLNQMDHPKWCSSVHCRAQRVGRTHESAPIQAAGLTLSVTRAAVTDRSTHAVVLVESDPDGIGSIVTLHLADIPDFARALLELYTC